jgi:hypothetical protein
MNADECRAPIIENLDLFQECFFWMVRCGGSRDVGSKQEAGAAGLTEFFVMRHLHGDESPLTLDFAVNVKNAQQISHVLKTWGCIPEFSLEGM